MKTMVLVAAFLSGAAAAYMIRYEVNAGALSERRSIVPSSWAALGQERLPAFATFDPQPAADHRPGLLQRPLFKTNTPFENRRSQSGAMQPPRTTFGY